MVSGTSSPDEVHPLVKFLVEDARTDEREDVLVNDEQLTRLATRHSRRATDIA